MNGEEAVSLNQIALEIKSDDIKVNESSWKDEKIEKLVEQLKNQQNQMDYFKKEVKTQVFANRRLRKTLVNTDKFLEELSGKIQVEHTEKNDVIKTLKMEVEAKDVLVKKLNEEFAKKDWANINKYETNRKELDEIKELIAQKDIVISQQLVKIISKDDEIKKNNERINVLEKKVYEHDIKKNLMQKENDELSMKLKKMEDQMKSLQKYNNALEDDITQLEIQNAEKKNNKLFRWMSKLFQSFSKSDDLNNNKNNNNNTNNNNNNNNNNKSLRKTVKGFFTRKSSSLQTQQTQQTADDVNDGFDVQQTSQ